MVSKCPYYLNFWFEREFIFLHSKKMTINEWNLSGRWSVWSAIKHLNDQLLLPRQIILVARKYALFKLWIHVIKINSAFSTGLDSVEGKNMKRYVGHISLKQILTKVFTSMNLDKIGIVTHRVERSTASEKLAWLIFSFVNSSTYARIAHNSVTWNHMGVKFLHREKERSERFRRK